jgi:hypothetical protein
MILLFIASVFVVPTMFRGLGEPLSLVGVGLVAVSALRRRIRRDAC